MSIIFDKCFPRKKVLLTEKHAADIYDFIDKMVGKRLTYPQPIKCMTKAEIEEGRMLRDDGHEGGAGHGLQYEKTVKINKDMTPEGILLNFIHENMHYAFPKATELEVDAMTQHVIDSMDLGVEVEDIFQNPCRSVEIDHNPDGIEADWDE